jgi:hypothetical protein
VEIALRPLIFCAPQLCGRSCSTAVVVVVALGSGTQETQTEAARCFLRFPDPGHARQLASGPAPPPHRPRLLRAAWACPLSRPRRARRRGVTQRSTALIRPPRPLAISFPPYSSSSFPRRGGRQRHAWRSKGSGLDLGGSGGLTQEGSFFRSAGDMAEEKSALQSAREWVVEHKLRAVGTTTSSFHILFSFPHFPLFYADVHVLAVDLMALLVRLRLQGRCGSAGSSAPSPTTGPGRA